ncbi:unnamed protein product [Moneuplotes crassus]|uniref:Uncharacterized protein n=1 Tax=Euplotes crassus TaxID=5936 RepID=A0AAD1XGE4_EUPCR|nr:unnamed protein product [Moneuplotes crassus]
MGNTATCCLKNQAHDQVGRIRRRKKMKDDRGGIKLAMVQRNGKVKVEEIIEEKKRACENDKIVDKEGDCYISGTDSEECAWPIADEVTDHGQDLEPGNDYTMSYKELSYLYSPNYVKENWFNSMKKFNPQSELCLDLKLSRDLQFLKKVHFRLPDLDILRLRNIPSNVKKFVKKFLKKYFPNRVNTFSLNYDSELSSATFYVRELTSISWRVKKRMTICNFEVNQKQFANLLSANKNKDVLYFTRCEISLLGVPYFKESMKRSTLRQINFGHSKFTHPKDSSKCSQLELLVLHLSECSDFKSNFETISIWNYEFIGRDVEQVLQRNGFTQVRILTHN